MHAHDSYAHFYRTPASLLTSSILSSHSLMIKLENVILFNVAHFSKTHTITFQFNVEFTFNIHSPLIPKQSMLGVMHPLPSFSSESKLLHLVPTETDYCALWTECKEIV